MLVQSCSFVSGLLSNVLKNKESDCVVSADTHLRKVKMPKIWWTQKHILLSRLKTKPDSCPKGLPLGLYHWPLYLLVCLSFCSPLCVFTYSSLVSAASPACRPVYIVWFPLKTGSSTFQVSQPTIIKMTVIIERCSAAGGVTGDITAVELVETDPDPAVGLRSRPSACCLFPPTCLYSAVAWTLQHVESASKALDC